MKIAAALIGLMFRLPFIALRLLVRNRVVLIIVIVAVGYFAISARLNSGSEAPGQRPDMPPYQVIAPLPIVAPVAVQTQSRVYYVSRMEEDGETVTLLIWYDYDADEWVRRETPLPLDKGNIKIYQRG